MGGGEGRVRGVGGGGGDGARLGAAGEIYVGDRAMAGVVGPNRNSDSKRPVRVGNAIQAGLF